MRSVIAAFLLTRLGLVVAGLAAPLFFARPAGLSQIGPPLLAMWVRWDGPIYITLARFGYHVRELVPVTAFFPLDPFLMQAVTLFSSNRELLALAGVAISNVALVVALAYIVALGRLDFDRPTGERAALYYLVAPTTLFLSAVYSESLFLAMSVGSFYHARRGQLALAGGLGLLAALTRPYGVLLALPIAIEAWRRKRLPIWALVPGLAVPLFFGWLWLTIGDPLAFFRGQDYFNRQLSAPGWGFVAYLDHDWTLFGPLYSVLDLVASVVLIVLTIVAIRRLPLTYGVLGGSMTLLLLMSNHLASMPRYALTVFPVFFVLAQWGSDRRFHWLLVTVSLVLALLAMARFTQWRWVA